jgi:hypothetical protein
MPPAYLLTPKRSLPEENGMALCPTPPRPQRSDSINHIVSMGPMNVPALKLCDADEVEELGFRFVLDPPPNIPCKRGNDEASSSFVPIERAHRSSISDPIVKIRPRPSRAFAASSTASTAHSSINMNIGITFTPIDDDDDDEEEEVGLTSSSSSPPRAKGKSAAANIITPTKAMMTRSMKKSYKLAVRNNNSSSRRWKEVRSTVNKNATAAATTTTTTATTTIPHPSCSSPPAA